MKNTEKKKGKDITKETAHKKGGKYGGLPASFYSKDMKKKGENVPDI